MGTVCAVVLTYNRKELLNECLQAIWNQTHPCDHILVVDNASSDDTSEMLAQYWADRVEVHLLPTNVGAAGGFNACMRLAYQTGMDHIWVMDDDVIADPTALARLLAADDVLASRNVEAPFLISTARAPSGVLTNVPEISRRLNSLAYDDWPDLLDQRIVPVERATFVSILLPRETLTQHGLPISSMFIWGEDSEFTIRVTRERPAYLVGDSRVVHVRQLSGMLDIEKEQSPARISYHFHRIRNDMYLRRRYEGSRSVARYVFRQLRLITRLCGNGHFHKARIVLSGIAKGLFFNPKVEGATSPFDKAGMRSFGWRARLTGGPVVRQEPETPLPNLPPDVRISDCSYLTVANPHPFPRSP
jgi:dTDP-4-dehydrorhamnose reductase